MEKLFGVVLVCILLSTSFFSGDFVAGEESNIEFFTSESYGRGYRYNVQGWIYVHIEGDAYERGFQHGYLLADEIEDMINRWINIFPQKNSWNYQKRNIVRFFWKKFPDEFQQEIKGIADGAASRGVMIDGSVIDYKDILTLNEMYEYNTRFRSNSVHPFRFFNSWIYLNILIRSSQIKGTSEELKGQPQGGCSAFLATGDATTDGGIIAAHSTFGGASEGYWWHNYISERFNVILDILPNEGNRILMTTSPGLIWSDEDFYQNNAGMILMETTLTPPGVWRRSGDPIVVRARKAIQYSESIDEMVDFFVKRNNGLMANDWLMGDVKTGEIASLELAARNHALTRKKDGFIHSCNNAKDKKVRRELNSLFGFGITGRIIFRNFIPGDRDIKFQEIENEYYGSFNVDIAKKIMTIEPIFNDVKTTDTKITSSDLVNDFGIWAFMGYPDGNDFISDDYPLDESLPNYTNLPASGWVQIFSMYSSNNHPSFDRKSYSPEEKSKMIWSYQTKDSELGNIVYSSPIISDKRLYVTSWNGDLSAIDANSGNEIWNENIGWSSTSTPLIRDNTVFVGSSDGLLALDKESGDILWNQDIGFISCKPFYFDKTVFCGSHNSNVYALDSENGEIQWTYQTEGAIYSSPVVDNNLLFIGSNDNSLYAINSENGEVKWKFETYGPVISSPIVHQNIVYFGSWDNNIYALDAETGKLVWKYTTGWGVDSSPVIKDNILYVGSEDNHLYSLNVDVGDLNWAFKTNAGISSSPIVYGGYVFFGSQDGKIYSLDAKSGDLIWSSAPDYHIEGVLNYITKPIVSSPSAFDGKIYVGSTNGRIYCYDAKTYEEPSEIRKDIEIPIDTWLLLTIPLVLIILATAIYLFWDRRKIY